MNFKYIGEKNLFKIISC